MTIQSHSKKKREARLALLQERNYDPNAHEEEDSKRTRGRASDETKQVYKSRVLDYRE